MKNISLLFAFVLLFSSCDELKKLTDVTFDADFEADMPLITNMTAKGDVGADEYPLGGSYTLRADENEDVADYLDKLKKISLKGYTMKPVGLSAQAVISSLVLKVNDVVLFEGTDITSTSVYTEADVSQAAIDEFTNAMVNDQMVTLSGSGFSNLPVVITISQLFNTEITANPLD